MKQQNQILNKNLMSYRILRILYTNGLSKQLYQTKIARLINSGYPNIAKITPRLKNLKLINLTTNKKDTRMKFISITPKGIRLMDEVIKLERILK